MQSDPVTTSPPPATEAPPPKRRTLWSRRIIAIISILALVAEFVVAQADIQSGTDQQASAIQIIQLWTPHLYYLLLIIGVTIALYIWTRATE